MPESTIHGLSVVPRTVPNYALFREWTRLEGVSQRSNCLRGATIYSPGEAADCIYLLKSGKIKIVRTGADGKRLIVHLVGPGEIFGESALVGEACRENSAEVLEDAVLWVIPVKPVQDWLQAHPEAWHEMASFFARRLRYLENAVDRLLFGEVEERVIRLLLELAKQYGDPSSEGLNLKIQLSQREFAHLIGSTRETTSSILNQLAKRGLIRIRRRRLSICSVENLAQAIRKTSLPPKIPPRSEGAPRSMAVREARSV
jgi:CRP/FNR family cyclic AMP-dependent transcriptional regulator